MTACRPVLVCHESGPLLNEVVPGVGDTWQKPGIQSQTNLVSNSVPAECRSLGFSLCLARESTRTHFPEAPPELGRSRVHTGQRPPFSLQQGATACTQEPQRPVMASHPEHLVEHECVCVCEVCVSKSLQLSECVCLSVSTGVF